MARSRRSDDLSQGAEFCSGRGDMQSRIGARRSWYAQECVGLGGRQRELVNKPVAVWNISPRSTHAYASLTETLRTMSANVLPAACLTLPIHPTRWLIEERDANPKLTPSLNEAIAALVAAAKVATTHDAR